MAYDLLVGTLSSKILNFWNFMGIGEFFMHISFIVVAVMALRALTCLVTCLFKIQITETAIWYPEYTPYFVSDRRIILFCSCIIRSVRELTLRLLISYIYMELLVKPEMLTVVYIWTYVWQR